MTVQISPGVKTALLQLAEQECLSLSTVARTGLEEWVRQKIHQQQEDLFYPKLRQIIHEDRQAAENRIVFFLMSTAFAAEQSRILITNVLKWVLKLFWIIGKPLIKTEKQQEFNEIFNSLVDDSKLLAERNIITKTQRMKRLHEEWKATYRDEEGKE